MYYMYYVLFLMQEVVEQERMEKHELKHQLRELQSVLNRTKDDLTMEHNTRTLEQLQYRKTMERVTMKSCIAYIILILVCVFVGEVNQPQFGAATPVL